MQHTKQHTKHRESQPVEDKNARTLDEQNLSHQPNTYCRHMLAINTTLCASGWSLSETKRGL
jgi:hypothetical protein